MSEQLNPTSEERDDLPAAPGGYQGGRSQGRDAGRDVEGFDGEYEDDEEEGGEEEGGEVEEEEERYVSGPAEYVQRERSGRGRRIGSEVRPDDVDYKNVPLLSRFLDRRGRILSRRKTRVSAKVQRRIVQAIKRARHLALIPYTAEQTRIVRKRR
jgi:small subunit ribosomal protein S18